MTSRLKHITKLAIAQALYTVGLLQLWQRLALRNKAVVLMYHRVLSPEERRRAGSHPGIVVERDTFAAHLALLKRRFVVVSLDEFADHLERRRPFASSSCLITFDDGWRDNFTNALPELRRQALPAAVFLPVNFIGGRRLFWREALTQLVVAAVRKARQAPEVRAEVAPLLASIGLERALDAAGDDPRPAIVELVAARTSAAKPIAERELRALAEAAGVAPESFADADGFMNWSEVTAMAGEGVRFGGHGAEHRLLTELSRDEARDEIRSSFAVVRDRLVAAVFSFSYPNGSWNALVASDVKDAGYRLAFTTEPGFVGCSDDRFALRRVNVHEDATGTPAMFLARIVGLF